MATLPAFPVHIDKNSDAFQRWLNDFYNYVKDNGATLASLSTTVSGVSPSFGDATTVGANTPSAATDYQNTHTTPIQVTVWISMNSSSGASALYIGPDTSSYVQVVDESDNYSPDVAIHTLQSVVPINWYWKVTTSGTITGGSILY